MTNLGKSGHTRCRRCVTVGRKSEEELMQVDQRAGGT